MFRAIACLASEYFTNVVILWHLQQRRDGAGLCVGPEVIDEYSYHLERGLPRQALAGALGAAGRADPGQLQERVALLGAVDGPALEEVHHLKEEGTCYYRNNNTRLKKAFKKAKEGTVCFWTE